MFLYKLPLYGNDFFLNGREVNADLCILVLTIFNNSQAPRQEDEASDVLYVMYILYVWVLQVLHRKLVGSAFDWPVDLKPQPI